MQFSSIKCSNVYSTAERQNSHSKDLKNVALSKTEEVLENTQPDNGDSSKMMHLLIRNTL